MSNTFDTTDQPDDDDRAVTLKRSQIRALEEKARGRDDAEQRAAKAERRLAFAEAGIPLSDPRAKYFVNGYDGELTAEAIRAEAETFGLVDKQGGQQEQQVPAEEQAAHQRLASAAAGAEPPNPTNANAALQEQFLKAQSPDEAQAILAQMGLLGVRE